MNQIVSVIAVLTALVFPCIGAPPLSFNAEMIGTAQIRYRQPRDFKGSEAGILRIGMDYSFTENLASSTCLRVSRSGALPVLEQAKLYLHRGSFTVGSGFLHDRIGLSQLYKPGIFTNRYIEHPVLWESGGFGIYGVIDNHNRFITLSASMNNRETGSVHTAAGITSRHFSGTVVAGAQANDDTYGEIVVKAGTDFLLKVSTLRIHTVSAFFYYPDYTFTSSLLVVPGYHLRLFGESAVTIFNNIECSCMGMYHRYTMSTLHTEKGAGLEVQYHLPHRLFSGVGIEGFRRDRTDTYQTELFFGIFLPKDSGFIRIGVDRVVTDYSSEYWRLSGNIWFVY